MEKAGEEKEEVQMPPPQWERERVFRSAPHFERTRAGTERQISSKKCSHISSLLKFTKHFSFRNFWLAFMCAAAAIS